MEKKDMTAHEVKQEITKLLEEIPEDSLPQVLEYLQQIKELSAKEVSMGQNLSKILKEDREVLEKLAQ